MSNGYPGLVLAFITCCAGVFPTVNAAEGLWQPNFDSSAAIRGGYVPIYGESWLCRYIDEKGLARVGAYFARYSGCEVHKDKSDNISESIPLFTDMSKVQFLASDNGAHSYAWIRSKDIRSLAGAIAGGSASSQEQTYVCRATVFLTGVMTRHPPTLVMPGTYYPSKGRCVIPESYLRVTDFDILFDLYSMCDNKVNPEYKKGTWSDTFDPSQAVEAGQQELQGKLSYVCRVRNDSRVLLGKHISFGPSCAYADGEKVEYSDGGVTEEVLVSTPSNLFGWSPQKNGNIAAGAMHGYIAQDGEPVFICRALADVGHNVPRSPGSLRQAEGACVTTVTVIDDQVVRIPTYEVLVDMRRTCDERGGSSLSRGVNRGAREIAMHRTTQSMDTGSHNLGIFREVPTTPRTRQQSAPISAINSHSEGRGSNDADADEYLARGFNVVKLALDSYASA